MALSTWGLDPTHSGVSFTIKHMMFSKVRGSFKSFEASIEADPSDLTTASVSFSVDLASVDTNNADRDNHLKSADFFDVENHPKMTFTAKSIAKNGDGSYAMTGDLSLHGVTKSETFTVEFEGEGKDPWGNTKAAFHAAGTVNRTDYGLKWNAALEAGGFLVGDEVKVEIEVQAVKQG